MWLFGLWKTFSREEGANLQTDPPLVGVVGWGVKMVRVMRKGVVTRTMMTEVTGASTENAQDDDGGRGSQP